MISVRSISAMPIAVTVTLSGAASAQLPASIDFMFLGKFDGKWKITQILWQSHPPKT